MVAKRIRDFSEGAAQIVLHLIFFSAVQNFMNLLLLLCYFANRLISMLSTLLSLSGY